MYVLQRIGDAVLPVPLNPPSAFPVMVADTLKIPASVRPTAGILVLRTEAWENPDGQIVSDSSEHSASIAGDLITIEECRLGVGCMRPSNWFPFELRFVGDSLVQQIPAGRTNPPRVYALVRTP